MRKPSINLQTGRLEGVFSCKNKTKPQQIIVTITSNFPHKVEEICLAFSREREKAEVVVALKLWNLFCYSTAFNSIWLFRRCRSPNGLVLGCFGFRMRYVNCLKWLIKQKNKSYDANNTQEVSEVTWSKAEGLTFKKSLGCTLNT